MKLGSVLSRLHELETGLADEYGAVGERHAADHDVYHQCHAFATQCLEHAQALAPHAERYDEQVDGDDGSKGDGSDLWSGVLERFRRSGSGLPGRSSQAGTLLLRDLRALYLSAEECSISWVMVEQAAKAARDAELLETVKECHAQTELQVKWLVTRIKVAAPQALVVG